MSTLNEAQVRKVARLARLKIPDSAIPAYTAKLNSIIGFVEQLGEVNTDGIEPLANVSEISLTLREDKVTEGGQPQAVLANAPESLEGFFVVPKVVE